MLVYRAKLGKLLPAQVQQYRNGARRLRQAVSGGEVALQEVKQFWRHMLGGQCLTVGYGSTETGISPLKSYNSMKEVSHL